MYRSSIPLSLPLGLSKMKGKVVVSPGRKQRHPSGLFNKDGADKRGISRTHKERRHSPIKVTTKSRVRFDSPICSPTTTMDQEVAVPTITMMIYDIISYHN